MISMIQQFFVNEAFRYSILMIDDKKDQNIKTDNKGN